MKLNEIIDVDKPIFAHKQGDRMEKLSEHSQLSLKYFDMLIAEKKLKKSLKTICDIYFKGDCDFEVFYSLLRAIVELHDTGKIGPCFQKNKMGNDKDTRDPYKSVGGSDHSLLSSLIYVDRALYMISEMGYKGKTLKKLKGLIMVNGYIISRHHSKLAGLKEFTDKFKCGQSCFNMVEEFGQLNDPWFNGLSYLTVDNTENLAKYYSIATRDSGRDEIIMMYIYSRLVYSLLVASDYYSTTEFINELETMEMGKIDDIEELIADYETSDIMKSIRKYEKDTYGKKSDFSDVQDINIMRSEMFLDAERNLEMIKEKNIFYLEAPTGSGKSNTAINLSLKLLDEDIRKIYYIYPYNTLIEQNVDVLGRSFSKATHTMQRMAVINALSPIMCAAMNKDDEDNSEFFQRAVLDRQFQNYPMILSTHVSLFRTMFGTQREELFSFLQLANSVIVLDEIQSYKNTIWSEIIVFLEHFAKLLNIKVIIMSATLPDLSVLSEEGKASINILKNRDKYFRHALFAKRVVLSYELLDVEFSMEMLARHIIDNQDKGKILVEFISKESAYRFYEKLNDMADKNPKITSEVMLMTGDDNITARNNIIEHVKEEGIKVILIATQVVEAGVDIDMDIGYKDISKLDSEEQFIGRINRGCKRGGKVYFFDCDPCTKIYRNDERTNSRYTLDNVDMREILDTKDFGRYYSYIMELIRKNHRDVCSEKGLEDFLKNKVGWLDFTAVEDRMKLIDDNDWNRSVFFNLKRGGGNNNTMIDPSEIWNEYKILLMSDDMDYAERMVKLSMVKSKLYNFIYEIPKSYEIPYDDSIGDLIYVEEGDKFFSNGKLCKKAVEEGEMFI